MLVYLLCACSLLTFIISNTIYQQNRDCRSFTSTYSSALPIKQKGTAATANYNWITIHIANHHNQSTTSTNKKMNNDNNRTTTTTTTMTDGNKNNNTNKSNSNSNSNSNRGTNRDRNKKFKNNIPIITQVVHQRLILLRRPQATTERIIIILTSDSRRDTTTSISPFSSTFCGYGGQQQRQHQQQMTSNSNSNYNGKKTGEHKQQTEEEEEEEEEANANEYNNNTSNASSHLRALIVNAEGILSQMEFKDRNRRKVDHMAVIYRLAEAISSNTISSLSTAALSQSQSQSQSDSLQLMNDHDFPRQQIIQSNPTTDFLVYSYVVHQSFSGVECDPHSCASLAWIGRDRMSEGDEDHRMQQNDIYHVIHCSLMHAYDCGYKLYEKEREKIKKIIINNSGEFARDYEAEAVRRMAGKRVKDMRGGRGRTSRADF